MARAIATRGVPSVGRDGPHHAEEGKDFKSSWRRSNLFWFCPFEFCAVLARLVGELVESVFFEEGVELFVGLVVETEFFGAQGASKPCGGVHIGAQIVGG